MKRIGILGCTLIRIPNHQAPNQQLTISWWKVSPLLEIHPFFPWTHGKLWEEGYTFHSKGGSLLHFLNKDFGQATEVNTLVLNINRQKNKIKSQQLKPTTTTTITTNLTASEDQDMFHPSEISGPVGECRLRKLCEDQLIKMKECNPELTRKNRIKHSFVFLMLKINWSTDQDQLRNNRTNSTS